MFKIFKKKDQQASLNKITEEMVLKVMKRLSGETVKDVIYINLSIDNCSIFASKFGGLPYLGKKDLVPVSNDNQQLKLIGQINLEELPKNKYDLNKGMLQFWALDNDLYGLDFDDMTSQKESRVIYYPVIDYSITEDEIIEKYQPGGGYFPIEDTFKLNFVSSKEGICRGDYEFDKLFTKEWNHFYPNNLIESYYDLPEEILEEDEFNEYSGFGHKLFGYPAFTQEDPRSTDRYGKYILLLQIDSTAIEGKEIMWGDSGICNFFITESDLKNKDFSKVLYNWDCY